MKVILISGKAQHGKDTVAKLLNESLTAKGHKVLIAHYGDLVKYVCKTFFDWNGEKDESGRTLLQYVGTDIVRKQSPNYWVGFIKDMLSFFGDEWDYVLIPDCRFPNEYEMLKQAGLDTLLLRVDRPNHVSGLTEEQLLHASETALDNYKYDYYITNNSDYDTLKTSIEKFVKNELLKKLTILVDIDEVLNNLLECWVDYLNKRHRTTAVVDDIKSWGLADVFPTLTEKEIYAPLYEDELWTLISPKPYSVEYLEKMINDGYKIKIVSASAFQTLPIKMEWLFKNFPYLDWNKVTITSDKQDIKGDIMIDDGIHNLLGGDYHKLLIDSPYNREFDAEANEMIRVASLKEAYEEIRKIAT